jgi:ubiquinone/menaquinone biosynthesis C-methylase UbiE
VNLWARIFALGYDPFFWAFERAGLAKLRERLLREARGRVLEIGAGTGLNAKYYPEGLDELVFAEPEPTMAARLERRIGGPTVRAGAESLPFPDDSFDTVVSTLVLCTVDDLDASLREIRRVLTANGQLLLLEHVRGDDGSLLGRCQDRLQRPWRVFACGCNCNRRTVDAVARAGFDVSGLKRLDPPAFMPPVMRPLVVGVAR